MHILFVCMGNICRSPTAAGVFQKLVSEKELGFVIESAGTIGYHTGSGADPRAQAAAKKRGFCLDDHRARQVRESDFHTFDLVIAMDHKNLSDLKAICPDEHTHKLRLFLKTRDVPDPYYGSEDSFEVVLDLVEQAAHELLDELDV